MKISIIIPTCNEEFCLEKLLNHLSELKEKELYEIIVSDGGSIDATKSIAEQFDVKWIESEKGRAKQMNNAVRIAEGDVYYFIHADSQPPLTCIQDILKATQEGSSIGGYRFRFNANDIRLKINSFFTRFDLLMMRGGDQTIFIKKDFFEELDGFDEQFVIMEDFDLIRRARKKTKYKIFRKSVLVSARKYDQNAYLKVQCANLYAFLQFYFGVNPHRIKQAYYKHLKQN